MKPNFISVAARCFAGVARPGPAAFTPSPALQPEQSGVPVRTLFCRAFSLIEVLVVVALLSVIIIGLVIMFSRTQQAYLLGSTQVDVLEGGRAVTDLLTRELSQVQAAKISSKLATNFYIGMPYNSAPYNYAPLYQQLPGVSGAGRTNVLQQTFFLTHENQKWTAVGYFVRTNQPGTTLLGFPAEGMGTLYRFETNYSDTVFRGNPAWPWNDFVAAYTSSSNSTKLLDGVVHFKLRAYTNGVWASRTSVNPAGATNLYAEYSTTVPNELAVVSFYSNSIPSSVEIELGVLEQKTAERARSISDAPARRNYLTNHAAQVHLFRWRVPVRNVDPTAFQ